MAYRKDLNKDVAAATSLAPAARTSTANGTGVDLQGYGAAMVVWNVGAITDGTHTPKLQESDDNSTFTDVAAANLSGTHAALTASTNQEIGYIGRSRYIRAVVTVTGSPSTGGVYAALVVRGRAKTLPQ